MSPRPNSRRSRALDQLQIAQDALAKALTLLGGRPRSRTSVKLPEDTDRTSRSFIISCINRLGTTQFLLQSKIPTKDFIIPITRGPEPPKPLHEVVLRDDFERQYDKERNPQC